MALWQILETLKTQRKAATKKQEFWGRQDVGFRIYSASLIGSGVYKSSYQGGRMSWGKQLKTALENLKFETGELAYLSLTSKPEHVIRDRLAFRLHQTLFPHAIVAREYKHIDLAILTKGEKQYEPAALVQLKTWSLFTFIEKSEKQFEAIADDDRKCMDVSSTAEKYCLLLSTCPSKNISTRYKTIVKYFSGWTRALKEHKTMNEIERQARSRIDDQLSPHWQTLTYGSIPGGEAFESPVTVHYWLVKKMRVR